MNAFVLDSNGDKLYPEMGSYGIGVSRLVGAIIEASHDEKGIVWPKEVAPFDAEIVLLHADDKTCIEVADDVYCKLTENGIDSLYDDRSINIGEKLNDADLIGLPYQILIGKNGLKRGVVEVKNRKTGEITEISSDNIEQLIGMMK